MKRKEMRGGQTLRKGKMKINIRVLHTSGDVTAHEANAPRFRKVLNAAVYVGSQMREADPTVAAIKVVGLSGYVWIGNYNAEQGRAKVKAETDNPNW